MEADSNIKNYLDIGQRAFGNKGRIFIQILIYMEQFLIATGFLILEGDNLQNLFHNVHIEVAGVHIGGRQCFVLLVALIILPTVWLDDLSVLAYISATGVLATAITLSSVFCVGAFDGVGFHQKGNLFHWEGIPLAISLYAFCYGSHPVFPTLYTSMKKKHQFSNVSLHNFDFFFFVFCIFFFFLMFRCLVETWAELFWCSYWINITKRKNSLLLFFYIKPLFPNGRCPCIEGKKGIKYFFVFLRL